MLLQQITMRYENTTSSFGDDASYIYNWYQGKTVSSNILFLNENNTYIVPFVIISILSIGTIVLITLKKKQNK